MGTTRIDVVSIKTRPSRMRAGRMAEVGGRRGVGVGIAMLSIGGLNFPAVWGVASGGQRIY